MISIDINPGHVELFGIILSVQVLILWRKSVTTLERKVLATLQGGRFCQDINTVLTPKERCQPAQNDQK